MRYNASDPSRVESENREIRTGSENPIPFGRAGAGNSMKDEIDTRDHGMGSDSCQGGVIKQRAA